LFQNDTKQSERRGKKEALQSITQGNKNRMIKVVIFEQVIFEMKAKAKNLNLTPL
jgi:hypothetical protein